MFHQVSKHLEVGQKNSAAPRFSNHFSGFGYPDETLFLVFDILHPTLLNTRVGVTPYGGLYREAPPERGAFFKLAVYKRVGKIAILVYQMVTKSAAKWKK